MCKHAGAGAGTGTGRLQSCLILRSVVVEEATAPDATESLKGDVVSPGDAGAQKPGMAENAKFRCDQSVEFWRSFQEDGFWSAQENLRELGNVGTRFAQIGPEALSHWLVSWPSLDLGLDSDSFHVDFITHRLLRVMARFA